MLLFIWFLQFILIVSLRFPEISIFLIGIVFSIFYIPTCVLIGVWDIRGNFQIEQNIIAEKSPLYAQILLKLNNIESELNEINKKGEV